MVSKSKKNTEQKKPVDVIITLMQSQTDKKICQIITSAKSTSQITYIRLSVIRDLVN